METTNRVTTTAAGAAWMALAVLAIATLALGACASGGGAGSSSGSEETASPQAKAPANHPFAQVKRGMISNKVVEILGEPDTYNRYMTGKSFIPFYFGSDHHRVDWLYYGKGKIAFTWDTLSERGGAGKVIEVHYDPDLSAD